MAETEEPRRVTVAELVKAAGLDKPMVTPDLTAALAGAAKLDLSTIAPYKGVLASGIDIRALRRVAEAKTGTRATGEIAIEIRRSPTFIAWA